MRLLPLLGAPKVKDTQKTKDQLLRELAGLHQRIAESEAQHERTKEELKGTSKRLRKAMESAIYAMAFVVEIREPCTTGHQREVASLAGAIAREMNLCRDEIENIRLAGALHDIGKIDVPTDVLNKPGPLTDIEFSIIKNHPTVGYTICSMEEFPEPIAHTVLQHHERMDGSGYPEGLLGEETVLDARIIAVADVIEAMSSRRAYRPALAIDEALKEISDNRGTLYDSQVVDASMRLFTQKHFTFD